MESTMMRYRALDSKVLAVAVKRVEGAWCAYIGAVPGDNHGREVEQVFKWGSKLSEDVAKAIFPGVEMPYAW